MNISPSKQLHSQFQQSYLRGRHCLNSSLGKDLKRVFRGHIREYPSKCRAASSQKVRTQRMPPKNEQGAAALMEVPKDLCCATASPPEERGPPRAATFDGRAFIWVEKFC